jgi:hypothetical protein
MAVFGGTRTHHRVWCAIEDAGFEIRDTLFWLHGQGFPKSKNVALAIDKCFGHPNRGRAIPTVSTRQAGPIEQDRAFDGAESAVFDGLRSSASRLL